AGGRHGGSRHLRARFGLLPTRSPLLGGADGSEALDLATQGMSRRPSAALPRRRKKNGKFIGSYFVRIGGKDITLHTQDPDLAHRRTREARKGKRDFAADTGAKAAKVVTDALTGTGGATTLPVVEPSPAPAQVP